MREGSPKIPLLRHVTDNETNTTDQRVWYDKNECNLIYYNPMKVSETDYQEQAWPS